MSVTVNVVVPEGALSVLRTDAPGFAEEMKRAAVAKWYEMGMVSQSKGSGILAECWIVNSSPLICLDRIGRMCGME